MEDMGLTSKDMLEYAAGRGDPETARRILAEFGNSDSPASQFAEEMAALAEAGLQVNWRRVLHSGARHKERDNG